jgi:DNA-3-methyladenine glycosylase
MLPSDYKILPRSFYTRRDVIVVARDLLGKILVTNMDNDITAGIIVETEAYNGVVDRASHAYGGKRTPKNEKMYSLGGTAYVYICYGIHNLFNVVTSEEGEPHAVLVRALEPLYGLPVMYKRRIENVKSEVLASGPGNLGKAMGIGMQHNGVDLIESNIFIAQADLERNAYEIVAGPRIGMTTAGEDTLLPYRFYYRGHSSVSKPHL